MVCFSIEKTGPSVQDYTVDFWTELETWILPFLNLNKHTDPHIFIKSVLFLLQFSEKFN